MRISDWSSDVCSSDLHCQPVRIRPREARTKLFDEAFVEEDDAADVSYASSFQLLALVVAAGCCVGLAPQSRIVQARPWGILARTVAGKSTLITALLRLPGHRSEEHTSELQSL